MPLPQLFAEHSAFDAAAMTSCLWLRAYAGQSVVSTTPKVEDLFSKAAG